MDGNYSGSAFPLAFAIQKHSHMGMEGDSGAPQDHKVLYLFRLALSDGVCRGAVGPF